MLQKLALGFFLLFNLLLSTAQIDQSGYCNTRLTVQEGMSTNHVSSILQDHQGFIWLGTTGGLNRYDGYTFKDYLPESTSPEFINSPNILRIFEDSRMNLWIGTISGGLIKLNLQTEEYTFYPFERNQKGLNDTRVLSICEDTSGYIWLGTWSHGINRLDVNTGKFSYYLDGQNVGDIIKTRDGSIWAVSYSGLWKYNSKLNTFDYVILHNIQDTPENYSGLVCIEEDPVEDILWLGGWGSDLIEYHIRTKQTSVHSICKDNLDNETHTNVYSLLADDNGNIWIGSWGKGLWYFSTSKKTLQKVNLLDSKEDSPFNAEVILDLYLDKDKNVWVGTNGAGLVKLRKRQPFQNIKPEIIAGKSVNKSFDEVLSICEYNQKLIVGTLWNGLFWNYENDRFKPVLTTKGERIYEVNMIQKTANGNIWVGGDLTLYEINYENGSPILHDCSELYNEPQLYLAKVNSFAENEKYIYIGTKQNSLRVFQKSQNGSIEFVKAFNAEPGIKNKLQNNRISTLMLDNKNRLWIGTYGGVHLLLDDSTILFSNEIVNENQDFLCDIINSFYLDNKSNIWIGTPYGLHKLTETSKNVFSLKVYTVENGLPENFINGIIGDKENIWLSTNNSIVRFNLENEGFTGFNNSDGIGVYGFNSIAVFKNGKNRIFMGGVGGITAFYPDSIKVEPIIPEIAITSFSIMNKPVLVNKKYNNRIILHSSVNYTNHITLTHKEKEFSFEIAALDYLHSDQNQYAYKLDPYNSDWIYLGNHRRISFSNLKPDDYTLNIKGSTNNLIWSEEIKSLRITILPPFWKTWYAFASYVVIITGGLLLYRKSAIQRLKLRKNIEMLQLKFKQEQELSEMKFRFFTNISHEFRTPLTLIIAPLSELFNNDAFKKLPREIISKIKIIKRNASQLSKLIDQILDFRKAETGKMKLRAEKLDICEFIEEFSLPFKELAHYNELDFHVYTNIKNRQVWFDREKFETILNNLISNAFKYVKNKGKILIKLTEDNNHVHIHIIDNGIGIPDDEIDQIFERFYQIKSNRNYGSSGIGLALTKMLVELHKGKIKVISQENKGSEFIVSIPIGNKHLLDSEILEDKLEFVKHNLNEEFILQPPASLPGIRKNTKVTGKKVLVVEDNQEVKEYLVDFLGHYLEVIDADNGEDAFEKALDNIPDIVISDIMMPKMDGFELCDKIKNHPRMKNIPVILLTAKSAEQYELTGLRIGADDFISKPFTPDILLEKVFTLISIRKKLKESFSKTIKIAGSDLEITPYEERFIKKAIKIIETNIQNQFFDVEDLAEKMNLSHSSLYRKIKSLTGYSVKQFILKIKMDKAAQLLKKTEKTLTEIALETGCSDLKQFRQNFYKIYSMSPKEYRKSL